ncbi:MAG: mandelate racemase/muconate lactonizing enzyme family protein [Chloroflexi bacterium]|nr:mandelate racemase/muconate lactonizing enzyme family protein [Chloroflexota bacterium]
MRVTDITHRLYRWPRRKPIRNGMFTYTDVTLSVVEIETDAGLTGLGLGGVNPSLLEQFKPLLIGADPFNVERHWHALWVPKLVGRRGTETRTISSLDIALWDLVGKATGKSVHQLLGGYAERIPVYIAGGYYEEGKGLKELADEMAENLRLGARAVKMKIGGAPIGEDVERVRVVRETVGPDVEVMVDANNAYPAHEAIRIAAQMEKYDIYWFEEPVGADDYAGCARVAQATTIPIATGENEYTRYGFRDLIQHQAASILNADANICGGVTEFRRIAALAASHDLVIAPHGSQDVHIHLVTGIPNGLILEYYRDTVDPMWGKTFKETLMLDDDGMLAPPDRPGFGITLNEDALAEFRVS